MEVAFMFEVGGETVSSCAIHLSKYYNEARDLLNYDPEIEILPPARRRPTDGEKDGT